MYSCLHAKKLLSLRNQISPTYQISPSCQTAVVARGVIRVQHHLLSADCQKSLSMEDGNFWVLRSVYVVYM